MKKLVAVLLGVLLSACGGGGGVSSSSESTPSSANTRISGLVLGPQVSGATVQAFLVAKDGTQTSLGQTRSAADGSYELAVQLPEAAVFMVQATGGTYSSDSASGDQPMDEVMRAVDVRASAQHKLHISPFSELGVRWLKQQTTADWSSPAVTAANAKIAEWLGVSSALNFQPLDLKKPFTGDPKSSPDVTLSLFLGAFDRFSKRLGGSTSPSVRRGLEGLERLLLIDPEDDRLFPAFLGGLMDFVDVMAISSNEKVSIKSQMFGGNVQPLSEWHIGKLMPKGISSGAATASMKNEGFKLVDDVQARTRFNKRGALIGFTSGTDSTKWTYSFTNSVAEMFGDGDIGIGRWNGGGIASASRLGEEFIPNAYEWQREELQYAVAAPVSSVPACGVRRLNLLASTEASLYALAYGTERAFVGLTSDSTLGLQYLGDIYVGADIGLRLADQSVVRFRTNGGSDQPWLSNAAVGKMEYLVLEAVPPAGPLANQTLKLRLAVGGEGARKVAAKASLELNWRTTEIAAAFGDSNALPLSKGCGNSGTSGPGLSSRPVDGDANIFMRVNGTEFHSGVAKPARFDAAGALTGSVWSYSFSGPVNELAGNAQASIGRIQVTETYPDAKSKTWSVPYAVSALGAQAPKTGSYRYTLVAHSGVMVERGSVEAYVPPGIISGAELEIVFGQHPVGTPNPWYGTAIFRAQGTIDGQTFWVGVGEDQRQAMTGLFYGEVFNAGSATGAISGPDGEFAVVSYSASIGIIPLQGTLLFKRQ